MKIIMSAKSVLYYSTFILGIRQWQNVRYAYATTLDIV